MWVRFLISSLIALYTTLWPAALVEARDFTAAAPIIDISPLLHSSDLDPDNFHTQHLISRTTGAIVEAFRDYGVFIATGLTAGEIDDIHFDIVSDSSFQSALQLFDLPMLSKVAVQLNMSTDPTNTNSSFGRGFLKFGAEAGLSEYFEPKEGFSYGYQLPHNQSRNMLNQPNIWPDGFSPEPLDDMYLALTSVVERLLLALNQSQHLQAAMPSPVDLIEYTAYGHTISLMRLFHYFAVDSLQDQLVNIERHTVIGSSPHTDWGMLTLIAQNDVTGLQFLHKEKWVTIPYIEHSVVFNCGDYFSLLTGGYFISPIHRVLAPQQRDRLSFVYFFYPNYESPLHLPTPTRGDDVTGGSDAKKIRFNTLLAKEQSPGAIRNESGDDHHVLSEASTRDIPGSATSSGSDAESDSVICFGEYIVSKWRGVFKKNY